MRRIPEVPCVKWSVECNPEAVAQRVKFAIGKFAKIRSLLLLSHKNGRLLIGTAHDEKLVG